MWIDIKECDHRVTTENLPARSLEALAGCTIGPLTLINEPLFKKMKIREQAKLIIHERLRNLQVSAPDDYIRDITEIVQLCLVLINDQLNKFKYSLSALQKEKIAMLMTRIIQLGLGT